jgi:two-component system, OmpR family, phosphate regulon response regulator PhoB
MPTQILIVEDDSAVQELLRFSFDMAGFGVAVVASGDQGLEALKRVKPDVAVIDWMLPGMSGLQLTRRIRSDNYLRDLPIIMLTARGEEEDRITGLDHGADDYVTKPFSPKELVARVKALLRRRAPQTLGTPVELAGVRLDPANHLATYGQQRIDLGVVEFKLLNFFMVSPDRVFTRDQILDAVWGGDSFVQDRTVDVYIRRVRATLEAAGAPQLIDTVRGIGYRLAALPAQTVARSDS